MTLRKSVSSNSKFGNRWDHQLQRKASALAKKTRIERSSGSLVVEEGYRSYGRMVSCLRKWEGVRTSRCRVGGSPMAIIIPYVRGRTFGKKPAARTRQQRLVTSPSRHQLKMVSVTPKAGYQHAKFGWQ
jgi:hypothetical protein